MHGRIQDGSPSLESDEAEEDVTDVEEEDTEDAEEVTEELLDDEAS